MKRNLGAFLPLVLIFGCGDGGDGSPDVPDDEPGGGRSPELVDDIDRSASLTGVDADDNGIRDDVERYIDAAYPNAARREAMAQTARAYQDVFERPPGDVEEAKVVASGLSEAINCIYSRFDPEPTGVQPAGAIDELRALTMNTKARLLAYLDYNKLLDGTSSSLPEGDTCD